MRQLVFRKQTRLLKQIERLKSEDKRNEATVEQLQQQLNELEGKRAELRAWFPFTAVRAAEQNAKHVGIDMIYSSETRIDLLREVGFALDSKGLGWSAYLFVDRAARYAVAKLPSSHGMRATTECWAGALEAHIGRIRTGW